LSGQSRDQAYTLLLGRSVEDNSLVVHDGESSLLTVGDAGSDKEKVLIIANLLSWPGSVTRVANVPP